MLSLSWPRLLPAQPLAPESRTHQCLPPIGRRLVSFRFPLGFVELVSLTFQAPPSPPLLIGWGKGHDTGHGRGGSTSPAGGRAATLRWRTWGPGWAATPPPRQRGAAGRSQGKVPSNHRLLARTLPGVEGRSPRAPERRGPAGASREVLSQAAFPVGAGEFRAMARTAGRGVAARPAWATSAVPSALPAAPPAGWGSAIELGWSPGTGA